MIIGIDPGPHSHACVVFDKGSVLAVHEGPLESILVFLESLKSTQKPILLAVEHMVSMGMAVGKSVFETCYGIGELRLSAKQKSYSFAKITRDMVKLQLCGTKRSGDSQIRSALIRRIGHKGTQKAPGPTYRIQGHLWSALACAVTCKDLLEGRKCHPKALSAFLEANGLRSA